MPEPITYSIDVGLHGLGIGLFTGTLLTVGYYWPIDRSTIKRGAELWSRAAQEVYLPLPPSAVYIETMQVYRGVKAWHVDPADLLELQGLAGALALRFRYEGALKVENILPGAWKGQAPKPVMTARIQGWIDRRGWQDKLIAPKPARRIGDLLDGVGLGMVVLGLEGKLCRA